MEEARGPETSHLFQEGVGQHEHISKGKMKFVNSAEQNFSIEIFRIAKVIERRLRPF